MLMQRRDIGENQEAKFESQPQRSPMIKDMNADHMLLYTGPLLVPALSGSIPLRELSTFIDIVVTK